MAVVALYSNKGGVGKTTAAVNLAYLAAKDGLPTLLVDLDAQGSATFYFRVKPKLKRKARGLTSASPAVLDSIRATDYARLDVLPADFSNRNLDLIYDKQKHRRRRLKDMLGAFERDYALIVLDCPPTINVLGENILTAADHLLVPLIPTTLSLRAHEQLVAFQKENEYPTGTTHVFFSMVDKRKKMHEDLMVHARQLFASVLDSPIPALAQVEQMGIAREPLPAFAPRSNAARAYMDLWNEIQGIVRPVLPMDG